MTPASFSALRRFTKPSPSTARCEICGKSLPDAHPHMVQPGKHKLLCACDACTFLLAGTANAKYLRVPEQVRALPDFHLTNAAWESLRIPIGLAFLYHSSPANRVIAMYPSPAGATESLLSLDTWLDIVSENPILDSMQPDVEALLVNRVATSPSYFLLPIDRCYQLVGIIRSRWHGISGGTEVWQELDQFFDSLQHTASPLAEAHA